MDPGSDGHIAAYEMLKCALRTLIPHADTRQLLHSTLNFDTEDNDLDTRRRQHRAAFHMTQKHYFRMEEQAYEELAAVLVTADISPCGEEAERRLKLELRVELTENDIGYVLHLLTIEDRAGIREQLARSLLDALPRGRQALNDQELLETNTEQAQILLSAVLRELWPVPHWDQVGFIQYALSAASLNLLFFHQFSNDLVETRRRVAEEQERRNPGNLYLINSVFTELYYRREIDSIVGFAEVVIVVEEQDMWSEILGRSPNVTAPAPINAN